MSATEAPPAGANKAAGRGRRDWILLPATGALAIVTILVLCETAMLTTFREWKAQESDCMVINDATTGVRGLPGCRVLAKMWEGDPVEYRFNRQGYRADEDFGPKKDGVYRIVLAGPSSAMGYRVPVENGFAALLPGELARDGAGRVEVLNESLSHCGGCPKVVALRLDRILAAKPDLVLWVLDAWDVRYARSILPEAISGGTAGGPVVMTAESDPSPAGSGGQGSRAGLAAAARLGKRTVRELLDPHGVKLMFEHYLYQSPGIYVAAYLRSGVESEYLKTEPGEVWKDNLRQTEAGVALVAGRLRRAGVPLALIYIPERAPVTMIANGSWPAGYDPYKLDDELRAMAGRQGAIYIDVLPQFKRLPDADSYFFPVDDHPNARGHAMLAATIAQQLTDGPVPALDGHRGPGGEVQ